MTFFFLIKEGFNGLIRARLASVITILTMMLSLLLVGVFGLTMHNLSDNLARIYNRIHLELFLTPSLTSSQIQSLKSNLQNIPAIHSVTYVSPNTALKTFTNDIGDDLLTLLENNPLPPAFRVVLKSGYTRLNLVEELAEQLNKLPEIDEVVYQKKIVHLLNQYALTALIGASIFGSIIFLVATVLIFNTIRLTIYARRDVIEIMKLVGATNLFIKGPFIVEGILQGFIGSGLAIILLWLLSSTIKTLLFPAISIPIYYLIFLGITGFLIGLLGSYISVGKYL